MSSFYNETDSDSDIDSEIREPDQPIVDTLIPTSEDFINNLNKDNYNEELYLKQALEESLKNAEDEYFAFQLEQIKNEEALLNQSLQMEEIMKLSLLESKKEERNKSLENILYQFIKLKKIDVNFNENLLILEDIIKKYINCEIDSYEIPSEIYKHIFDELRNIRVKENELNLIKEILVVTH
jgi:hypothetical protein